MLSGLPALAGLFFAAFGAATVLPIQSEIVFASLFYARDFAPSTLVAVATVGNVLGSVVNWLLGRYFARFQDRRWFPIKGRALERATRWYRRWGFWSLLLAWAPFIGDPLTLVAGLLRANFAVFVVFVTAGKVARYVALAAAL